MVSDVASHLQPLAGHVGHLLWTVFLAPGSTFSLLSLGFATAVSAVHLARRRPDAGGRCGC
ncbi:MAG: hypothetical protein WDM92_01620 [Caulobacteraceae bacterium]